MKNMGYLEHCTDPGETAAEIQARLPAQLGARGDAAGRARRHWPSNSDSPFRPRPNYAVPSRRYGFPGRKLSSLGAALLFAASGAAQAATINAASASRSDVASAIASAVDGDTVVIPAGTASWTSGLVLTKGITLMGQTTTNPVAKTADDQTIILDDVARGPGGTPIIWVQGASGKTYRVSGITFRVGALTESNYNGGIRLSGNASDASSNSHAIRVDNCHFDDLKYQNDNINVMAAIYGVIDHNVFDFRGNACEALYVTMGNWGGSGSYGDGSWADLPYYGSEKFVFFEDNCVNNTTGNEFAGDIDDSRGGRWVCRYNHFYDTGSQSHGTEFGRDRGGRAREFYNNDLHWTVQRNIGGIRSGGFLTHDNVHTGSQPYHGAGATSYRIFQAIPPWGGATGDNPWDVNVTESNGTHVDGHSPYLFDSGTATAGSTTTLTDSGKSWATNRWSGYTVKRVSDGGMAIILSNTATVLALAYSNSHSQGTTWAAGNAYQIHKVLISQDQAGRGKGDLVTGDTPVNSTTGTAAWTHQALEPLYMWNDVYNPGSVSVTLYAPTDFGQNFVLTEGVDFYNNTPMPGYTPYTYPHPLVSSAGPQAPGDLHIIP
jgi:hypothetical protein